MPTDFVDKSVDSLGKNPQLYENPQLLATVQKINNDQTTSDIEIDNTPALDIEVANFIHDIENKQNPLADIDFSIDILKIISFLKDSKHP